MLDLVKVKKLIPFLTTMMLINFGLPVAAAAESLDSLQEKEAQAKQSGELISKEINSALDDVNAKYAEIERLKTQISKAEDTLKTSKEEIEKTEKNISRRKEAVGDRMKDIQLNGDQRTWQALLDAENLSDFFNRAYAMTVLQNFEREKIESLTSEKEKLAALQEKVENTQTTLKQNEEKLQVEASSMNNKVSELKEKMANNEELLAQISTDKQKEQQRLVSEKAAAEAQKKRAAETAKAEAAKKQAAADKQAQADAAKLEAEAAEESSSQASSSSTSTESSSTESSSSASSSESSSTPESSTGESSTPGTGSGRVLQMESTAYSWREAGASNLSATGIDLSKQSNVVAVDPSVIPLGSLVKVSGYGFAIAGDTGGAIQGNIIDVHFDSVDQCRLWGRRQVTVEIQ
ncbi:TPA: 3D domain-containing protein [Enterococcus faecalis]|uniref:3D domain-containing protein n=1 Tax=Enterococcus TaxID=1350 RepID=UPI00046C6C73|nr:3D domain-containing protein [Enterococcus faecalis]EGO2558751.1 peptidase M23 [Enterococcus faecalis]EGO2658004.1 peptidase M23 [Enterococcus faecalis]EGO2827282.1 peptidase M23 [Enterococcus faecalis]EGO5147480.1 peptidase M23 [Enterococcus faecalis]EGO5819376.1 peptidase M23 [Enterococcus faecalis]